MTRSGPVRSAVLALVESNTTGTGRMFAVAARARGLRPVVLTTRPERYPWVAEDAVDVVVADTSDAVAVKRALEAATADGDPVAGVVTSSEYFAAVAARAAAGLGLPGADPSSVERCRDKRHQRAALAAAGVPVPAFAAAGTPGDAAAAAARIGFPVVVKPADGTGSRGVRLCGDPAEIADHTATLLASGRNERGHPALPAVVVEEYVPGPELSVETFGGEVVGLTAKYLGPEPWFVETGHDFPAELRGGRAVGDVAVAALRALGLGFGPVHTEIRLGRRGPVIIEVNPRLAGGRIPTLVRLATGVDLVGATVDAVIGDARPLPRPGPGHASIRFLVAPRAGRVRHTAGVGEAATVPGVVDVGITARPGQRVGGTGSFLDRVGHVIAAGPTGRAARAAAEEALSLLRVDVDVTTLPWRWADVDDTGRIRRPLTPTARRIVFGKPPPEPSDLALTTQVDRAHLVMLAEQRLVDRAAAAAVLVEIELLRAQGFAPLEAVEARRGRYLAYEDWLAGRVGERTAGVLRTGRSRNDLNATVLLLRLRPPVERLLTETLRLQASLLAGARRHAGTVMPAYTHYQPAVPTTYGHHLGGVSRALDRDIEAVAAAAGGLDFSPLGAGTGHGSALPIAPARTASLLGFELPSPHALDAVASRDVVLRLLSAAAVLGVTVSRLAADLLLWTTAEFAFLELPDELVGSSSAMPQKRNPFLLEHVKGRSARAAGAFVAAATAMHATPFANSVAVGTEGCAGVVEALGASADAVTLLRLVVSGARARPAAMLAGAAAGQTTATAMAERLMVEEGLSFREAHRLVGQQLTDADAARRSSPTTDVPQERRMMPAAALDPVSVARAARFGGGPGAAPALDDLRRRRAGAGAELAGRVRRWQQADTELAAAVADLIASERSPMLAEVGRHSP